jgi:acyl-[acyl carrier protein]--UDP-N-acetylglucosamine O-acyltransferase
MQINALDNALKHITARFRLRGFTEENSKKIGKNFENIFNIFKKNIEREIEVSNNDEQRIELTEVRDFLSQSLDVIIVQK